MAAYCDGGLLLLDVRATRGYSRSGMVSKLRGQVQNVVDKESQNKPLLLA